MSEHHRKHIKRLSHMRRVPPFPGVKQSNKFTILYAVDTSGSMSTRDLELSLSELQRMQKADSDIFIKVIYADTGIAHEYDITSSSPIDFKTWGRGGTDFECVFERALELCKGSSDAAPDILVYATDGYAPPPTTKLPIPVVWLITPTGRPVIQEVGHITLVMKDYASGEEVPF